MVSIFDGLFYISFTGTINYHKRPLELSTPTTSKSYSCAEFLETNDKRLKSEGACQIHHKVFKENDERVRDAIYKWQMRNITKCMYDNAVNIVLDSISSTIDSVERQNALNATYYNFTLENEAVQMAIEWKGLKHQYTACSCSHDENSRSGSPETLFSSKANNYFRCSESRYRCLESEPTINSLHPNDETLESNFENNFINTAVSAAIEEKGLSMYPV